LADSRTQKQSAKGQKNLSILAILQFWPIF
jgi:hypothetical protein